MKMIATRNFTLGRKDGTTVQGVKGEEVKDVTEEEAYDLYEKDLISSTEHDKKKKMFELDMEISKVKAEMEKAAREAKEKEDELEKLREGLKNGGSREEEETTEGDPEGGEGDPESQGNEGGEGDSK